MAFLDFLFGKEHKSKNEQLSTMTPEQTQFLQMMMGGLQSPMQAGMGNLQQLLSGSPEAFAQYEAPYKREFNERTIPGLAERFSSLGAGAQGSSAFGQQMGQAGAGLSETLAALRGQLQQNALSQLQGFAGMGMGAKQFENMYTPAHRDQGFLQAMAPGIGAALGGGMGMGMGSLMGNLFKPKSMFG